MPSPSLVLAGGCVGMREDGEGGQAKATGWGMPSWAEYFTPDSGFQHLMTFFHEVLKKKNHGYIIEYNEELHSMLQKNKK